jgi:hypothetical protein
MYGSNTSLQYFQIFVEVCIIEFIPVTLVFIFPLSAANRGNLEASVNLQAYAVLRGKRLANSHLKYLTVIGG